jgi:putative ABC transport system permease protein
MSSRATVLIARRSIRARFGRLIAISIAILVGVSFVVGSFVLADSLRKTFDDLFTQISQNVDLRVRSAVAFGDDDVQVQRDPIPASVLQDVEGVEGVAATEPLLQRFAQIIAPDGEVVKTQGAPTLGVAWTGNEDLSGLTIKEGAAPSGLEQVAVDKATADREDIAVGDQIQVITDTGTYRSPSPRSSGWVTATASPGRRSRHGTSPRPSRSPAPPTSSTASTSRSRPAPIRPRPVRR